MMQILYYANIIPANQAADGETPTAVLVTEEVNGHAVWHTSHEEGNRLVKFYTRGEGGRDLAIEHAVDQARLERKLVKS